MKKMWLVLALFLGLSGTAHAGVMIEPYLGFEMGKFTDNNPDAKTELVNMGARLAWTTPVMLWLGLDYNLGVSGNYKPDSGSNETMKRNTLFAVAGIDLPILLRGWVGYGVTSELKMDGGSNAKYTGNPIKIGVGFTALPFISLNLEYINENINKVETNSGTDNSPDNKASSYMLSVSLPLHF
ncbi:hypothetical protein DOM22_06030 [Bdellovibrio sp. ZAP7]|nr:hypothetical protein DOM22_06030 [Bdellovibrio sp. ZAP7]